MTFFVKVNLDLGRMHCCYWGIENDFNGEGATEHDNVLTDLAAF